MVLVVVVAVVVVVVLVGVVVAVVSVVVTVMIVPPTGILHLPVQREHHLPGVRVRLSAASKPSEDGLPQADAVQVPVLHQKLCRRLCSDQQ